MTPAPMTRQARELVRLGTDAYFARHAGIAQLVEHNLAKVGVAGSSPVSRSARNDREWPSAAAGRVVCPARVAKLVRRGGLKIRCPQGHVGSIPTPGMAHALDHAWRVVPKFAHHD
jgi:hypothetical protein